MSQTQVISRSQKILEWSFIVATGVGVALSFTTEATGPNIALPLFIGVGIGALVLRMRSKTIGLILSPAAHLFDFAFAIALFFAAIYLSFYHNF